MHCCEVCDAELCVARYQKLYLTEVTKLWTEVWDKLCLYCETKKLLLVARKEVNALCP